MERNGVNSIKITVLERFNYLAVSEQSIEPRLEKFMKYKPTNKRIGGSPD